MFERLLVWIAWQLPKELVSHVYARVVANYTRRHGKIAVPDVKAMDALKYWIYGKDN